MQFFCYVNDPTEPPCLSFNDNLPQPIYFNKSNFSVLRTEDPNHPHYTAARNATKHVYKVDPDMTREGGSIPVTLTLQEATGKNVLLLPVGACDDGAHSQNEKIDIRNYIEGTKLLGAYLYEVAKLQ